MGICSVLNTPKRSPRLARTVSVVGKVSAAIRSNCSLSVGTFSAISKSALAFNSSRVGAFPCKMSVSTWSKRLAASEPSVFPCGINPLTASCACPTVGTKRSIFTFGSSGKSLANRPPPILSWAMSISPGKSPRNPPSKPALSWLCILEKTSVLISPVRSRGGAANNLSSSTIPLSFNNCPINDRKDCCNGWAIRVAKSW